IRSHFPGVQIIENSRNLGFAEGNNVGMHHALQQGTDYIFLLNDDAVVTADALSLLMKTSVNNSGIGMLCPGITSFFDRSKHYVGAKIEWKHGVGFEIEKSPHNAPEFLETDYAPGCAVLIKADAVCRIGL